MYDLTRDPHERENLAGQNVETKQAAKVLGTFGSTPREPGASLADPKDKWEILERYRAALDLVADRRWPEAIALLQRVLRDEPEVTQVWNELADVSWLANRYDVALDAYRHVIELEPSAPAAILGRPTCC